MVKALLSCQPWGHKLKGRMRMLWEKNDAPMISDLPHPWCSFLLQLKSVSMCVSTVFPCLCLFGLVSLYMPLVCVCFQLEEPAAGSWHRGFLPIRTRRKEQMELSEVCSQSSSLLQSCHFIHPNLHHPSTQSVYPSCALPLQFHQSTWSFFNGKARANNPWRIWLYWNIWPQVIQYKIIKAGWSSE